MTILDSYIKSEWLDYPTSKVDSACAQQFATWLIENDSDEFQTIATDESIQEFQLDLVSCQMLGDKRDIENAELDLKRLIDSIFQESLITAIEQFKNSYDEDEENDLEEISFDNARSM